MRTKISPKSGRGLGHVTPTIFGSTVGYPRDSLASCLLPQRRGTLGCWSSVVQPVPRSVMNADVVDQEV